MLNSTEITKAILEQAHTKSQSLYEDARMISSDILDPVNWLHNQEVMKHMWVRMKEQQIKLKAIFGGTNHCIDYSDPINAYMQFMDTFYPTDFGKTVTLAMKNKIPTQQTIKWFNVLRFLDKWRSVEPNLIPFETRWRLIHQERWPCGTAQHMNSQQMIEYYVGQIRFWKEMSTLPTPLTQQEQFQKMHIISEGTDTIINKGLDFNASIFLTRLQDENLLKGLMINIQTLKRLLEYGMIISDTKKVVTYSKSSIQK